MRKCSRWKSPGNLPRKGFSASIRILSRKPAAVEQTGHPIVLSPESRRLDRAASLGGQADLIDPWHQEMRGWLPWRSRLSRMPYSMLKGMTTRKKSRARLGPNQF